MRGRLEKIYLPLGVGTALSATIATVGIIATMDIGTIEVAVLEDASVRRTRAEASAHGALSFVKKIASLLGGRYAGEVRGLSNACNGDLAQLC